ncbi:MAG: shikimate kinase [Nitrososphaerota archaeon]|nr:shikimate kinase [Nitrososphaerota archaeon]MDG6903205.1 shikimate kinase [Nitrososphaerota archaeon]MDG6911683.1 shikimate kinase [Nitrososphaerota archaeon]MDG6940585.1 shikimate kinase [Nitrososphaerota archaeon]MDG6957993.1 shikimate kinase [Nitrososphaerota archaeon]
MIGRATAMGAVSVVNAIASGRGASLAVDLPTTARVTIREERGGWTESTNGSPATSTLLQRTVRNAIRILGENPERYSGRVETETSAPVGVGLKTSSSSSVAAALATFSAFGRPDYEPKEVLECSVSASLASGTSITGAMDDAAACLLGGGVLTNNRSNHIVATVRLGTPLVVLIRVPHDGSRRASVRTAEIRRFAKLADSAFDQAMRGGIWKAMILNGLLYSAIYGYPNSDAFEALESGALGAGLSGTGPAVACVFDDAAKADRLESNWKEDGGVTIRTETCNGGATIGH